MANEPKEPGFGAEPQPWITTTPGLPPGVDVKAYPVKPEEIEAQKKLREEMMATYGSLARKHMTPEHKWLGKRQTDADIHRLNLKAWQELGADPEYRGSTIQAEITQAIHAAHALRDLGEFDEAIEILAPYSSLEIDGLRQIVLDWKAAEELDDSDRCDCDLPTGEHKETHPKLAHLPAVKLQAPKHHAAGRYFSKRKGQVVKVWVCAACGHKNGHNDEPEGHQDLERLRAEADRNARLKNLQGHEAAPTLPDHYHDRIVLAVK